MASGTMVSFAGAQAMGVAIRDLLDAGSLGAVIEIRTGAPPANVEAASTGTLLATLTCGSVSFDGGVNQNPGCLMTAASIDPDTSANDTGVAGYFVAGSSSVANTIAVNGKVIMGTCGLADADMLAQNADAAVGFGHELREAGELRILEAFRIARGAAFAGVDPLERD